MAVQVDILIMILGIEEEAVVVVVAASVEVLEEVVVVAASVEVLEEVVVVVVEYEEEVWEVGVEIARKVRFQVYPNLKNPSDLRI